MNHQNHIIRHNDEPEPPFDTSFTGNRLQTPVFAPVTNTPQRFFRVRQP